MDESLAGRTAVITGVGSGIGRATILKSLDFGAAVVAVERRAELAKDLQDASLVTQQGRLEVVIGDVGVGATAREFTQIALDRFGNLDVLINNAAVGVVKSLHEHTPDEWDLVLDTNVKAIYRAARHVIPVMIARGGGVILNAGSISGEAGIAGQGASAASKGAVHQMTRQMAIEYAPTGSGSTPSAAGPSTRRSSTDRPRRRAIRPPSGPCSAAATPWAGSLRPRRSPSSTPSWLPTRPPSSPARRSWWTAATPPAESTHLKPSEDRTLIPRRFQLARLGLLITLATVAEGAVAQDAVIRIRADRPGPAVSRHMTGACIEDVNHEIYGGISSQMIFGESFQEPPPAAVAGFAALGGRWVVAGDVVRVAAGDGPKLLSECPPLLDGEVAVQVRFDDDRSGLAGLILRVNQAGSGADHFQGYEVSLDPSRQMLTVGRHRQNWEHLRDVPCEVPVGRWIDLVVRLKGPEVVVQVEGRQILRFEDREHPLGAGAIGLRTWRKEAAFRWLRLHDGPRDEAIPFAAADPTGAGGTSGMWRVVRRESAVGALALEADRPFVGVQSQRVTLASGAGAIGLENRGLNRQGLGFEAAKVYEGALWLRADQPTEVHIAAESADGSRTLAEATVTATSPEWTRHPFTLTPSDTEGAGRLAVTLQQPGSVVVGFVSLEPGPWGRFKNLPVRRDVTEGLIDSGITVMRLGGLMANADGYRWKNMVGPRDRRPPYRGYWYPHSSNGWGIFEFLDLCEAAGFLPIVDLNMDESPPDLADFLRYANGPADSPWGRRRAEAGHPKPYGLRYVELGNEEAIDEAYWRKFRPLAEAAWAQDPDVVLIVGDFEYRRPIVDPTNFDGAPRIRSLATHKEILDLAKARRRSVWFDVHIWNHSPGDAPGRIAALQTFDAALARLSPGADYRICVLEENATNHAVRRAVAHAETIHGLTRLGDRVPIVCAANALQPDGQNDNGWDQGLVLLNPSAAWLQPPAYVSQMIRRHALPRGVAASAEGDSGALDVAATRSDDGLALVLQVANTGTQARAARVEIGGFAPRQPSAVLEQLAGPWDAANTADEPTRVAPRRREWRHDMARGVVRTTFPPRSFTILRFE